VQLSDYMNKKELLGEMGGDIEIPCGERDSEMEEDTIFVSNQHVQKLDVLGSTRIRPGFPPLPDLDLDLICDIMSF
jgi:hypothetical protein